MDKRRPQFLCLFCVAGKCNILIDFLKFILRTASYFSFESQFESTRERGRAGGRAAKPRGINLHNFTFLLSARGSEERRIS